jgi:hypothetical protein
MKRYLAFLIVLASHSLAQAQHEIRCKLVDTSVALSVAAAFVATDNVATDKSAGRLY